MNDPVYAIIVDKGTTEELNAVHELVKKHSPDYWWHRFTSFWIVTGLSAAKWRDLIKPAIPSSASSVLVLKLPDNDKNRNWSFTGPNAKERCKWLHDYYA